MVTAYGITNLMQAVAATRADKRGKLDPRLLWRLGKDKIYVAGVGVQAIGTVTSFLARRDLPLFLVQASIGAGIVVTVLLGVTLLHWRLPAIEIGLIVAVLAGVTSLIASAQPGKASDPGTLMVVLLGAAVFVYAIAAHFAARLQGAVASVVLGAIAGTTYGTSAMASRPLVNASSLTEFLTDPLLYIFLANTVAGQLFFGMALQHGATTGATASMNAMVAIPPALVGLFFLGDHIKDNMHMVAALGFALTVSATVALAWFAQPQQHIRRKNSGITQPTQKVSAA